MIKKIWITGASSGIGEALVKKFAAEQIFKGLTNKNSFEIHFPKSFTYFMKTL